MNESVFKFDTRVLMCAVCNAPVQSGIGGGEVKCEYCGAVNQLPPRKDLPKEPCSEKKQISEEERLTLLRQQLSKPPHILDSIKPLLEGSHIARFKLDEALQIWRSAYKQLAVADDFEQSEMLLQLTIFLGRHFEKESEFLKQRSLFENALEVLTLPRHRQMLRSRLAVQAAFGGDVDAAERWIEPCDPTSSDLQSDSAYRIARAAIDTVKQDWQAVLSTLREQASQSPLEEASVAESVLMRANAMEKLGQEDKAVMHLALYCKSVDTKWDPFKKALESYQKVGLSLCRSSHLKALAEWEDFRTIREDQKRRQFSAPYLKAFIFFLLGLPLIIISLFGCEGEGATIAISVIGTVFVLIGLLWFAKGRKTGQVIRLYKENRLYGSHF